MNSYDQTCVGGVRVSDERCVILFAKDPSAGVKTRLAARIGSSAAAELYKGFLLDTLRKLDELAVPYEIAFCPAGSETRLRRILGDSPRLIPQQGGNLGERMRNAFLNAFGRGCKRVVLIGSDLPDLPSRFLEEALLSLEANEVVVGPARDGGYYLIGFACTGFVPEAFESIVWSTDSVFTQTLDILRGHASRIHLLPQWYDIDTFDDLRLLLHNSPAHRLRFRALSDMLL